MEIINKIEETSLVIQTHDICLHVDSSIMHEFNLLGQHIEKSTINWDSTQTQDIGTVF